MGEGPQRKAAVIEKEPGKTNDLSNFGLGEAVVSHRVIRPEGERPPSGVKRVSLRGF
jgi:hypothetical protein